MVKYFVSDIFVSTNSTQEMWSIKPDYRLALQLQLLCTCHELYCKECNCCLRDYNDIN